jgi:hypothetical protein
MKILENRCLFTEVTAEESATVAGGKTIKVTYDPKTGAFSIKEGQQPVNTLAYPHYLSFLGFGGGSHNGSNHNPDDFSVTVNI